MGEALFVVMIALQAIDGWSTYQILKAGGVEKNPVVRLMAEQIGTYPALVIGKGLAIGLAYLLIPQPAALFVLVLAYAGVVGMNWRVYRNQRKRM